MNKNLIVIFDGDCRFCTLCMRICSSFDFKNRCVFTPSQLNRYGLTEKQVSKSVWIISKGEYISGMLAVYTIFDTLLGVKIFSNIYKVPFVKILSERIYSWVALNRGNIPGISPYCKRL